MYFFILKTKNPINRVCVRYVSNAEKTIICSEVYFHVSGTCLVRHFCNTNTKVPETCPCFLGFDSCIYLQVITCFCNFVGCADDHCFLFVAIISIVLDFQVNKSSSHNLLAIPVGINQKRNVDTIARKV